MRRGKTDTEECGYQTELEKESRCLLELVEQTDRQMQADFARQETLEDVDGFRGESESLKRAAANIRKALVRAYAITDELNARCSDIKSQNKKRKLFGSAPSNTVIDLREQEESHFARGLNAYKILLICFAGSFVGVVVELMWCLLTNGYLESRSGLVYGPFNLLYGVGAVALTVCLYRFRNRGKWISFLGGMAVGSVVEYACSWWQETVFGSRSWDYSGMPFNLNGRICLLYSIFWGFLGVLWIKDIYPRMAKLLLKVPNLTGKIATWVLVVFFIFNGFMTMASMTRWSQRLEGVAPQSSFAEFLDERFPNERMERIFANMEFNES